MLVVTNVLRAVDRGFDKLLVGMQVAAVETIVFPSFVVVNVFTQGVDMMLDELLTGK